MAGAYRYGDGLPRGMMKSDPGPDKLTPRHEQMAMMFLAGKTNHEIAAVLGYTESRVSIIKASPLFVALMENLRKQLREHTILDTVDKLHALTTTAVDALEYHAANYAEPAASVAASKDILDRNPRTARISRTENERTLRFIMSDETARRLENALAEDEGRVVPVAALPVGVPTRVRTLDEALAEMEEH